MLRCPVVELRYPCPPHLEGGHIGEDLALVECKARPAISRRRSSTIERWASALAANCLKSTPCSRESVAAATSRAGRASESSKTDARVESFPGRLRSSGIPRDRYSWQVGAAEIKVNPRRMYLGLFHNKIAYVCIECEAKFVVMIEEISCPNPARDA
jgi:hypothetical protein